MSRSYFHRRHRKFHKSPRWFTNMLIVRPERCLTRVLCAKLLLLRDLEDAPEFPKGNKPNAHWSWN